MITNESQLIAALVNGQRFPWNKASLAAEGAGTFASLWKVAGFPSAGANPPAFGAGAGYVPTSLTQGAFPYANPSGQAYAGKLSAQGPTVGTLTLYDRLWACSGFNTNITTLQSVVTPGALPVGRDPNNGADVEPWLEVYTAPGATGSSWTMTGVDANGTPGQTWIYTKPANAESVGQMMPFVNGGSAVARGCRQVTSFQASVASGAVGDVGITLLRRIAEIPITQANVGNVLDAIALGLVELFDDSCLAFQVLCSTTSTGFLSGQFIVAKD